MKKSECVPGVKVRRCEVLTSETAGRFSGVTAIVQSLPYKKPRNTQYFCQVKTVPDGLDLEWGIARLEVIQS